MKLKQSIMIFLGVLVFFIVVYFFIDNFGGYKGVFENILNDKNKTMGTEDVDLKHDNNNLKTFINTEYGYMFNYPSRLKVLGECHSPVQDPTKCFFIDVVDPALKLKINLMDVSVRKINNNDDAIELAKNSLKKELEINVESNFYDYHESEFNGLKSYDFVTREYFSENIFSTDPDTGSSSSLRWRNGAWMLEGGYLYKVIYFNYHDYIWRIIYPLDNEASDIMINSFEFLK